MRTQQEIYKQISGLLLMKKTLPERSKFGDPNWEAIDAQVEILTGERTDEDFEDAHEYIYSQARDAQAWVDGDSDEYLFEG